MRIDPKIFEEYNCFYSRPYAREAVYLIYAGKCQACEEEVPFNKQVHVGHIIPRLHGDEFTQRFGSLDPDNLLNLHLLCAGCNLLQGATLLLSEFHLNHLFLVSARRIISRQRDLHTLISPERVGIRLPDLSVLLFTSALFSIDRIAWVPEEPPVFVQLLVSVTNSTSTTLRYEGPRLTQAHLSILLGLLLNANHLRETPHTRSITNGALVSAAGWSDSGYSRRRVAQAIQHLGQARVSVRRKSKGLILSNCPLIRVASKNGDTWAYEFGPRVLEMFGKLQRTPGASPSVRSKLKDGLESWLYGYACNNARDGFLRFRLSQLAALLERADHIREFRRAVAEALGHILELGLIKGFKCAADLLNGSTESERLQPGEILIEL